jgi:hypothetical protein
MAKELLILVYKINIQGLSRQVAQQQLHELMQNYCFSKDEDIKENYIIKEIWLPITEGQSDVKVVYPTPQYSIELEELVKSVSENMKKYPDSELVNNWNKILRSLKLRKLELI